MKGISTRYISSGVWKNAQIWRYWPSGVPAKVIASDIGHPFGVSGCRASERKMQQNVSSLLLDRTKSGRQNRSSLLPPRPDHFERLTHPHQKLAISSDCPRPEIYFASHPPTLRVGPKDLLSQNGWLLTFFHKCINVDSPGFKNRSIGSNTRRTLGLIRSRPLHCHYHWVKAAQSGILSLMPRHLVVFSDNRRGGVWGPISQLFIPFTSTKTTMRS